MQLHPSTSVLTLKIPNTGTNIKLLTLVLVVGIGNAALVTAMPYPGKAT